MKYDVIYVCTIAHQPSKLSSKTMYKKVETGSMLPTQVVGNMAASVMSHDY